MVWRRIPQQPAEGGRASPCAELEREAAQRYEDCSGVRAGGPCWCRGACVPTLSVCRGRWYAAALGGDLTLAVPIWAQRCSGCADTPKAESNGGCEHRPRGFHLPKAGPRRTERALGGIQRQCPTRFPTASRYRAFLAVSQPCQTSCSTSRPPAPCSASPGLRAVCSTPCSQPYGPCPRRCPQPHVLRTQPRVPTPTSAPRPYVPCIEPRVPHRSPLSSIPAPRPAPPAPRPTPTSRPQPRPTPRPHVPPPAPCGRPPGPAPPGPAPSRPPQGRAGGSRGRVAERRRHHEQRRRRAGGPSRAGPARGGGSGPGGGGPPRVGRVPGRERGGPHARPRGPVSLGVGLGARREAMEVAGGGRGGPELGAPRRKGFGTPLGRRALGRTRGAGTSPRPPGAEVAARSPVGWHGGRARSLAGDGRREPGRRPRSAPGGTAPSAPRGRCPPPPGRRALSLSARAHGRVAVTPRAGGRGGGSRAAHRWWNIKASRGRGR